MSKGILYDFTAGNTAEKINIPVFQSALHQYLRKQLLSQLCESICYNDFFMIYDSVVGVVKLWLWLKVGKKKDNITLYNWEGRKGGEDVEINQMHLWAKGKGKTDKSITENNSERSESGRRLTKTINPVSGHLPCLTSTKKSSDV